MRTKHDMLYGLGAKRFLKNASRSFYSILGLSILASVVLTLPRPKNQPTKLIQAQPFEVESSTKTKCFDSNSTIQNVSAGFLEKIRNESYILRVALKRNQINGINIVALSNYAYRNMTLNWIASLIRNKYLKFLIFSYDQELAVYLAARGFQDRVVILPNEWNGNFSVKSSDTIADWLTNTNDLRSMVKARLYFWLKLLDQNVTFLFSDIDLVFLSGHVLEHLVYTHQNSLADVLFTQDQFGRAHIAYNTGFFYATPTQFVKDLFGQVKEYMLATNDTDQIALQRLVAKSFLYDKRIEVLDHFLYATGNVYCLKGLSAKLNITPLMYHANYYSTSKEKLDSLQKERFWFIKDDGTQIC